MADANPFQAPEQRADKGPESDLGLADLLKPLDDVRALMRVNAIVLIIASVLWGLFGVFALLSGGIGRGEYVGPLIMVVLCWVPFLLGRSISKATENVRLARQREDARAAKAAMGNLATFFRIIGIITVVYILLFVIGIFAAVAIPNLLHR